MITGFGTRVESRFLANSAVRYPIAAPIALPWIPSLGSL